MTGDRYEVTGHSEIGLPVEYPMAVASKLGGRFADAFAPADGYIGKIQATNTKTLSLGANQAAVRLPVDGLIQEPVGAELDAVNHCLVLLDPGEWTVEMKLSVRAGLTATQGTVASLNMLGADGTSIRSSVATMYGPGTFMDKMIDVLVPPEKLPATVELKVNTTAAQDITPGVIYNFLSAKKTTRYAIATTLSSEGSAS